MSNRPQFRIFDTEEDKFFTPTFEAYKGRVEELLLVPHGDLLMRTANETIHESTFSKRYMVDMYTGRTDTKGFPIHVRDVVVINGGPNDRRIGAVEFDEEKLAYVIKAPFLFNRMELHERYTFTIIGNCYHNQDLLSESERNG